MKTQTGKKIVDFIAQNQRVTAKQIIDNIGFSAPAIFRQLATLIKQNQIAKQGKPPKVFYYIPEQAGAEDEYLIVSPTFNTISKNFLKISPDGVMQSGVPAFKKWCRARGFNPGQAALDYEAVIKKYDSFKRNGLIDGLQKLKKTFPVVYLDEIYYLDFYSLERFGKTKLGELVLYAKQSQSRELVELIANDIKPKILELIKNRSIDAIGFVPPTVKRQMQFMKELEKLLNLSLPLIKITKIKTPIIVPQKTLNKLDERMQNAHNSIVVEEDRKFTNILLIDDAVGSGATINEVAHQIREKNLNSGKLIGLAITGSFSGFDIIQEV
ncbi:MAG: hypothetical protein WCW31_04080 [Patescibacteria group bacterium]|jgi:hypothetical protein